MSRRVKSVLRYSSEGLSTEVTRVLPGQYRGIFSKHKRKISLEDLGIEVVA